MLGTTERWPLMLPQYKLSSFRKIILKNAEIDFPSTKELFWNSDKQIIWDIKCHSFVCTVLPKTPPPPEKNKQTNKTKTLCCESQWSKPYPLLNYGMMQALHFNLLSASYSHSSRSVSTRAYDTKEQVLACWETPPHMIHLVPLNQRSSLTQESNQVLLSSYFY